MSYSLQKENKELALSTKKAVQEFDVLNLEGKHLAQNLISVLMNLIQGSKELTLSGLMQEIRTAGEYLIEHVKDTEATKGRTVLVLRATQTIYLHYMSKGLMYSGASNLEDLKKSLLDISQDLINIMGKAKERIQTHCFKFLRNRIKILIVGYSSVVVSVLKSALQSGYQLEIFAVECRPTGEGIETYNQLKEFGSCKLIFDTAIGYFLEQCDMVLTGAEAVAENGGIINRIGTYSIALCAKALKKPFYVLAESFKFARLFPLNQNDLSDDIKENKHSKVKFFDDSNVEYLNPQCDYTPPDLITLLFTDVGIFTPSAVSEELIQIFNT